MKNKDNIILIIGILISLLGIIYFIHGYTGLPPPDRDRLPWEPLYPEDDPFIKKTSEGASLILVGMVIFLLKFSFLDLVHEPEGKMSDSVKDKMDDCKKDVTNKKVPKRD